MIADWKTIKDNYAREKGWYDWKSLSISHIHANDAYQNHIDAVSLLRAKQALENANHSFEKHYYLENADAQFERHKIRELIKNESNIPQ